jgi:hypothetical protein
VLGTNKYPRKFPATMTMCHVMKQAWNISTWQAAIEFFEMWFHGFASSDFIFLNRDSIFFGAMNSISWP